ncbi:MAG: hypothetical protein M3Z00_04275 [Actinomycetota bacterium]|nr:hypothetical protein [Actinomycetota bacterium]
MVEHDDIYPDDIQHDDIHHDPAGQDAFDQHIDSVLHAVLYPDGDPIYDSSADPSSLAELSHDGPAARHLAAPDIELTEPGGTAIDLGPPNQDMNGDGVPESAVHTGDDHLLIVSDTDADGAADHVIDIDAATGHARWITIAAGEWVEEQRGHVDDDGALVVDRGGGDPHGLTSEEQLTITVNGRTFPAGTATIDTDGDGVPDTVAVTGLGGSTQLYQDSNGDGVADRAWTVNADGSRGQMYAIDEHGHWVAAPSGAGSVGHSGAGLLSRYETGG